ncbi:MAG TPA: di-heme oxidoredictase family protein, partial [Verrucomicrobiota bacterium]|nr:di-heme oxidoredictase family protein [Verrucomicrobiota bacterium]
AAALNTDMGVVTTIFPKLDGETTNSTPELSAADLDLMTRYVALLGVGARRNLTDAQALQGEQLFATASCVKCHTPTLTTSAYHPMAELRSQTIHPYTDLLLHDMGPGLADNMGEGAATGSEWRTAPLWNIGLTAGVSGGEAYLHDGRARSLEEAILWHGGEAEAAKEAFRTMSAADRAALIKFLKSL